MEEVAEGAEPSDGGFFGAGGGFGRGSFGLGIGLELAALFVGLKGGDGEADFAAFVDGDDFDLDFLSWGEVFFEVGAARGGGFGGGYEAASSSALSAGDLDEDAVALDACDGSFDAGAFDEHGGCFAGSAGGCDGGGGGICVGLGALGWSDGDGV